ncbi:MAG: hypothetical protein ACSHX3_01740 [Litorimonas sp.]
MKIETKIFLISATSVMIAACTPPTPDQSFQDSCIESIKQRLKSPTSFLLLASTDVSKPLDSSTEVRDWRSKLGALIDQAEQRDLTIEEKLEQNNLALKLNQASQETAGRQVAKKYELIIEYEAQNSFGASIRDYSTCEYEGWTGQFNPDLHSDNILIDGQTNFDLLIKQVQ